MGLEGYSAAAVYEAAAPPPEEEGDAYGVSPSGYSGKALRLLLNAHRTAAVALTPALLVGHALELVGEARPAGGEAGRLGIQRGSYQRGSPDSGAVSGSSVCIQLCTQLGTGGANPVSMGFSRALGCWDGLPRQGAREEPGRLPPQCASLIGNGRKSGMAGPRCER